MSMHASNTEPEQPEIGTTVQVTNDLGTRWEATIVDVGNGTMTIQVPDEARPEADCQHGGGDE